VGLGQTPLLTFSADSRAARAANVGLALGCPVAALAAVSGVLWIMVRLPGSSVRVYPLFAAVETFLFLCAGPLGAFSGALFASFAGLVGGYSSPTAGAALLFAAHGVLFWLLFRELNLLEVGREAAVNRWEERADRLAMEVRSLSVREETLREELDDAGERAKSYHRLQDFADDLIGAYAREELAERTRRGLEGMFARSEARVRLFRESNAPDPADEWGRRAVRFGRPQMFPSMGIRVASLTEGGFLFVPLRIRDSVIGWISLERKPSARPFRLQDLRLAVIAAGLASLAVGNAERYAQIESLAISDGLTGLFTRGYMDERLSEELTKARHLGWPFSFLLLDIDRFKKINDEHGHRFGDEVLRWLARQVTAQSRDTDFVARYGGEEFAVLMPNTAGADALSSGRRIIRAVAQTPFRWESKKVHVTVSGGVASLAEEIVDSADLLRRADEALYRAKTAGRNRVLRHE